ncbi:MAG: helix-turn-helix transcriptional regulator [Clostridia bacterium]|nr:helix-turn-helix transcriptional regulator [Clostridia bacterium]
MLNKNKLKGAIVSAGMTQKELASRIGMSENGFSSKLAGKSSFDASQIVKICDILGITDAGEKVSIFLSNASQ